MQQVGRSAAASSIIIDPRRIPQAYRRRNLRPLANANRIWVLHRQLILRTLLALAVLTLLGVAFQSRARIATTANVVGEVLQGEFAGAGLGIGKISISGQVMTRERDVLEALDINSRTWIVGFDAEAARQRLIALPAVKDATIRKIYPNELQVVLTENKPIARWRGTDGKTYLIDAGGARLGEALSVDDNLPLVIGAGAEDDALVMIRALQRYPDLSSGLVALSRLADRRWDMIYRSGLRVRLPETGVAQAMKALETYQDEYQLLDRAVTQIDLRVPGMLVVRPAPDAEAEKQAG